MSKDTLLKIAALVLMVAITGVLGWLVAMKKPAGEGELRVASGSSGRVLEPPVVLTVAVNADGYILMEGAPVTIEELETRLQELKGSKLEVFYYRQGNGPLATIVSGNVIKLLAKYEVAVSLFESPDPNAVNQASPFLNTPSFPQ